MVMRPLGILFGAALSTSVLVAAGCSSSQQPRSATVHGSVRVYGGAPLGQNQPTVRVGSGTVLVFTNARRSGTPIRISKIHSDGSYSFEAQPGRYYLATTAASTDSIPAPGPAVIAVAGRDKRADIAISIK